MGFGPSISFCGPASAVQTATASHTISACRTRHALHTRWILALPTAALHCTSAVDGSAGLTEFTWRHGVGTIPSTSTCTGMKVYVPALKMR